MSETEAKRYKVIDGPLTIRDEPDGKRASKKLAQGTEIEVTGEAVNKGGYNWVQHADGWSALSDDDETEVYMLDISNRDPNAPRIFRVWAANVSIRESANGKRLAEKLFRKAEITVEPQSQTEAGNYIWWKHDKGWSAERSINGNEVFLKEVLIHLLRVLVSLRKRSNCRIRGKAKWSCKLRQMSKSVANPLLTHAD
ncbi:MAG: hypothetical protein Q9P01_19085 [Anaerolineae bacterium]|nr:hypothetical protein [Anaerolineae bacterium]